LTITVDVPYTPQLANQTLSETQPANQRPRIASCDKNLTNIQHLLTLLLSLIINNTNKSRILKNDEIIKLLNTNNITNDASTINIASNTAINIPNNDSNDIID
jgi:hypothetical protein